MRRVTTLGLAALLALAPLAAAHAGDGATLVFESGQLVRLNNGYGAILSAMKNLNDTNQKHRIVELNLEGNSFLLNVAEVVIVCRDRCSSLEVQDLRDPARSVPPR
jgi:hypothetical protein